MVTLFTLVYPFSTDNNYFTSQLLLDSRFVRSRKKKKSVMEILILIRLYFNNSTLRITFSSFIVFQDRERIRKKIFELKKKKKKIVLQFFRSEFSTRKSKVYLNVDSKNYATNSGNCGTIVLLNPQERNETAKATFFPYLCHTVFKVNE